MSGRIILRDWDRPRFFELDVERGRLVRNRDRSTDGVAQEVGGFVKSCVLGPTIAVYRDDGVWRFRIAGHDWRLVDPELNIVVRRWLFGRRIEVECRGVRYTCKISDLAERIIQALDPTYDRLDQEIEDFPLWLAERRAEARRTEPDLERTEGESW